MFWFMLGFSFRCCSMFSDGFWPVKNIFIHPCYHSILSYRSQEHNSYGSFLYSSVRHNLDHLSSSWWWCSFATDLVIYLPVSSQEKLALVWAIPVSYFSDVFACIYQLSEFPEVRAKTLNPYFNCFNGS